ELDRQGLMMFGQMTAGSWIYIGSQGIVQGPYEPFAEWGRRHYGGSLAGRWILTAGLGGMGGAQPLAATFAGASMLAIGCPIGRANLCTAGPPRSPLSPYTALPISRAGRWTLTAGLGGMGGAQPLAATFAGASMLAIEC